MADTPTTCGLTSQHVTNPCIEPTGHAGFHRTAGGTKWGSPAPGQCWACEDDDAAWYCSACGGHGDDGRVPVAVRCPSCKGTARARFRDAVSGDLACIACDQVVELVELVDPEDVHAKLRLPENA